jgi:hypothetical protein
VPAGSVPGPTAPGADPGPGEPGSTVKRAELSDFVAVTTPPDRIGPVVPALLCPSGHVNPAERRDLPPVRRAAAARPGTGAATGTRRAPPVTFAALAASSHGFPVQHVSLNDGGIWVTNNSIDTVGRFTKPIGQLDGELAPPSESTSVDVWQNGSVVAAYDASGGRIYAVNVYGTAFYDAGAAISPAPGGIALGDETVAVLSTDHSLRATALSAGGGSLAALSASAKPLAAHLPADSAHAEEQGPKEARAVAVAADAAVFGPADPDDAAVSGVWQLVTAARRAAMSGLPMRRRLWVAVNPVSLWASRVTLERLRDACVTLSARGSLASAARPRPAAQTSPPVHRVPGGRVQVPRVQDRRVPADRAPGDRACAPAHGGPAPRVPAAEAVRAGAQSPAARSRRAAPPPFRTAYPAGPRLGPFPGGRRRPGSRSGRSPGRLPGDP